MLKFVQIALALHYTHSKVILLTPPPPTPLYIGLGQREAQVNHELLFHHA